MSCPSKTINRSIRALFATLYLVWVILTIPLAFDVGGVNCGLAFSLTLLVIYFILTTIQLLARRTKYFKWISLVYYGQHFLIPSLLTYFLSYYSNDPTIESKFNPVLIWKFLLINATPIITILEGFCSLLLIQAIGQTVNWLTLYKSDSWLIISLIGSAVVDTGAFYCLYRIYVLPVTIDILESSLLGSLLTLTFGLCLFGIVSGKGSMIESSLLFAYIVRCIYETFPSLAEGASQALANLLTSASQNVRNEIPKIPPSIMNPISELVPFLTETFPLSFKGVWEYLVEAIQKLPLSLLLNLAYRIGVFYAATKIIPSLYKSVSYPSTTPLQQRSRQPSSTRLSSLDSSERVPLKSRKSFHLKPPHHQPPSAFIRLIYAYSPCLVIAVYTHLMLSYIGELGVELQVWPLYGNTGTKIVVHPWKFWNWINMGTTLILYVAELSNNESSSGGGNSLTSHWKVE
ncbi:Ice2 protein [Candida orthopsilosis Co 90-125]|uniref:Ice2 protein n=1 Tax=Candida orthopsilosis (strain 90-125) TaxID=1136231 RepID=H8X568_CANO9|nr:Ice2 protein [Candida orthopsilosis Co 90-125]CCG23161.1 Ice2 protein [Candida orthopsilosis Co 90-125]